MTSATAMRPSSPCTTTERWTEPTKSPTAAIFTPRSVHLIPSSSMWIRPMWFRTLNSPKDTLSATACFQTQQGPSFPAHQFLISGTSAPTAGSNLFAAENPTLPAGVTIFYGCTSAPGTYVNLIDPSGDESQTIFPCFEHPTLTDLLDAANVDWRYYTPGQSSIWNGPNAIQHIRMGPDWKNHMALVNSQVLVDISQQKLPTVSRVIPGGAASDHPAGNDGAGPSW